MDIGTAIGFVVTLLIFSYLLGDNFLYRLAIYVAVGLGAALTTIVTLESVLLPLTRSAPDIVMGLISLGLALVLLFKPYRRVHLIANLPLAFLVAVGAAVAVVGALSGTLIPIARGTAAGVVDNLAEGLIIVVGVVTSLLYFQYAARRTAAGDVQRGPFNYLVSLIGQGFIVITLGMVYAGLILTSLTILTERISFLIAGIGV